MSKRYAMRDQRIPRKGGTPTQRAVADLIRHAIALTLIDGEVLSEPPEDPMHVWDKAAFTVTYWQPAPTSPEYTHYTVLIEIERGFEKVLSMPPPGGIRAIRKNGPPPVGVVLRAAWYDDGDWFEVDRITGNWEKWFVLLDPKTGWRDLKDRVKKRRRKVQPCNVTPEQRTSDSRNVRGSSWP